MQIMVHSAGVWSKLYCRLSANTIPTTASTLRTRVNGTNGTQSISITAATSGEYRELSNNTDTIAAADKISCQFVPGAATGTITMDVLSSHYVATTDTVSIFASMHPGAATFATASTTTYSPVWGLTTFNATENNSKSRFREAGTLQKMCVNISANARTTDTTFRSRKNGVNGNLVVTVTGSTTGWVEEVSPSSDTIAVDDDINFSLTTGTGAQTIGVYALKAEFISTAGNGVMGMGYGPGLTFTDNTTSYLGITDGGFASSAVEANFKTETREAFVFSELSCRVTQNDMGAPGVGTNATLRTRKNGANGGCAASCLGNTTGHFGDISGSDTCVATDEMNLQMVVPSVGGTHTVTLSTINLFTFLATTGNNVTKSMPTETVTVSETSKTLLRNKIRTRSETITVSD